MDKENKGFKGNNLDNPKPVRTKKTKRNTKVKFNPSESGSKKNLILIFGAALLVIVLSAAIFLTLSSLFSTESYYVLNTNVKAKQQITADMVVPRETAKGTGPVNALKMEEIQRGDVFSKYPLYAGDVVALSNAGPLAGQSLGIPDDWVVTSFSTTSTDAVGGILGKGDYVDILGISEAGSKFIFNNLLILEVKFVNEEVDGKLDGQTVVDEAMHYTVGMPAEQAAYFHSALYNYENEGKIKIIKAPTLLNYSDRDVTELDDVFKYDDEISNFDGFDGTDPTFTDIERDEDGKPLESNTVETQNVKVKNTKTNDDENTETSDDNLVNDEN